MGFLWFGNKKKEQEALKNEILNGVKALLEEAKPVSTIQETDTLFRADVNKPYKKIILSNSNLTVVLNDGTRVQNSNASKSLYNEVVKCTSEYEVKRLLAPELEAVDKKAVGKAEEERVANENLHRQAASLKNHSDFEEKGGVFYLKGIDLSLPKVMIAAFIEVLDDVETLSALKNFWYWLALNPNPESREDLYRFIEKNEVKITPKGLLVLYRSIVSKDNPNKALVEFVSTQYAKVKMAKKGPANYYVWKIDGQYSLIKGGAEVSKEDEAVGNLKELYLNLPNLQEQSYTDAHTHSMDIKIGAVYSIEEEEVDRDNKVECSTGLHVGSKTFGIGSFGDTKVMALVNPMKVRAVPNYDAQKMRVSEMFIVGVLELVNGQYMDQEFNLVDMDDVYFNIGVEELEEMARNADIKELAKHSLLPQVSFKSFNYITDVLKAKDTIKERLQLLD